MIMRALVLLLMFVSVGCRRDEHQNFTVEHWCAQPGNADKIVSCSPKLGLDECKMLYCLQPRFYIKHRRDSLPCSEGTEEEQRRCVNNGWRR